jgi:hypothetical protein
MGRVLSIRENMSMAAGVRSGGIKARRAERGGQSEALTCRACGRHVVEAIPLRGCSACQPYNFAHYQDEQWPVCGLGVVRTLPLVVQTPRTSGPGDRQFTHTPTCVELGAWEAWRDTKDVIGRENSDSSADAPFAKTTEVNLRFTYCTLEHGSLRTRCHERWSSVQCPLLASLLPLSIRQLPPLPRAELLPQLRTSFFHSWGQCLDNLPADGSCTQHMPFSLNFFF